MDKQNLSKTSGAVPGRAARPMRRGPGRLLRRVVLAIVALVVVAIVAVIVVIERAQPGSPGQFYSIPSPLPSGSPGTIIRSEALHDLPAGAVGWKVLYLSTGFSGAPTAVSGVLIVPADPAPPGGRHVVAFAYGTVGVASRCAPSLLGGASAGAIDGLSAFLRAGDAVVATDYQGLGTPGPHPYLVGKAEAMAVLDGVRAAHNLQEAAAGTTFVVWGASQGGHAALFTGQYAVPYAPELRLVGVAAAAPASNLTQLFQRKIGTDFGNLLAAFTISSWARVYPHFALDQIVQAVARPIVQSTANYCIHNMTQALPAVLRAKALKLVFLHKQPWATEPWKTGIAINTPGHMRIPVPIFIGQGSADPLVQPDVQAEFVRGLCAAGGTVQYRTYADTGHVEAGQVAAADATAWIADRFAAKPAPSTCG